MPASKRKSPFKVRPKKRFTKKKRVTVRRTSTSSYKPKSKKVSINRKPKKTGTNHWLSFGKGMFNMKREGFLNKLDKVLPTLHQIYNTVGQLTCTSGVQNVGQTPHLFNPYDIYTNFNDGSSSYVGAKKHLISGTSTILFTNQGNNPVFLTLYDYCFRRDIHTNQLNLINLNTAWTNDPTITAGAETFITGTPFDSPAACQTFKITSVTRINLSLGETCEHILKTKPNRIWDDSLNTAGDTNNDTNLSGGWRNLTMGTLMVLSGAPGDASNSTTGSLPAKVDWICTTRHHYAAVNTMSSHTLFTNNIGTAAVEAMDIGSGVATGQASA